MEGNPENYRWAQPSAPALGQLCEQDRMVLAFERRWWKNAGAKEEAVRRDLGQNPMAYYQALDRLLDDPRALAADPALVRRLQRLRASRRRRRASRRLGPHDQNDA